MTMTRLSFLIALSLLAGGCTTLQPQQDYSRISDAVTRAGAPATPLPVASRQYLDPAFFDEELTVDRAAQAALANNPKVRAELARLDTAHAERVQAGLLKNPMLSLMVLRPEGGGRYELDYGLTQDLFDLFTRSRRVAVADAASDRIEAEVIGALVALVQDTRAAYFEVQVAQARVDAQHVLLRLENEALALRKRQAGSGAIAASAILEQQSAVSVQAHEAGSAQSELDRARATLAQLLGMPTAAALRLPAQLPRFVLPGLDEPGLQALAQAHRSQLQAAAAFLDETVAERSLQVGALRSTEPTLGPAGMREASGMSLYGGSVQVSLPVFDTGRARRDIAAARVAQAEFAAQSVRRQVPLEVEVAIARLLAADAAAKAADHHLQQQRQLETLAHRIYRQGAADASGYFQARRALLASVMDQLDSQQARWDALIALERATGSVLSSL